MSSALVPGAWTSLLTSLAGTRGAEWFPELDGAALTVRVEKISARSRSTITRLELSDGRRTRRAVAKLRQEAPGEGRPARPGIVPEPLSAKEQAALEYRSLQNVYRRLGTASEQLRAVRPLEHLPDEAGVVMEYVDATPGSRVLTSASRLLRYRRPDGAPSAEAMFRNAGTWLREFHAGTDDYRPSTRPGDDPAELFAKFEDYLGAWVGPGAARLAGAAGRVVPDILPDRPPTAVGHGDFAVRNLLVESSGRVCVIDAMPRWRVPVLEDLARFLVGVRLQGLQVSSQGAAYSARFLDARERDFAEAYHAGQPPAWEELQAYQLLILFDKWAALTARRDRRGWRTSVPLSRLEDRYVAAEARRLLTRLDRLP